MLARVTGGAAAVDRGMSQMLSIQEMMVSKDTVRAQKDIEHEYTTNMAAVIELDRT
jgi:hypothetical protein